MKLNFTLAKLSFSTVKLNFMLAKLNFSRFSFSCITKKTKKQALKLAYPKET